MGKPRGALLVLDLAKDGFGELGLRLVRLGVDALPVAGSDEAELMARQERIRIRGMLLPASVSGEEIDHVLESIGARAGVGADAIAVVGPRPEEVALEALRRRGVGWRLWEPLEDRDLVFVAGALLWLGPDADLRLDARWRWRASCAGPRRATRVLRAAVGSGSSSTARLPRSSWRWASTSPASGSASCSRPVPPDRPTPSCVRAAVGRRAPGRDPRDPGPGCARSTRRARCVRRLPGARAGRTSRESTSRSAS